MQIVVSRCAEDIVGLISGTLQNKMKASGTNRLEAMLKDLDVGS